MTVPPHQLTTINLHPNGPHATWATTDTGEIVFNDGPVHCELLLKAAWDTGSAEGHRFVHTRCSDGHPLHSEAIEAAVLHQLSDGRQLLRGSTWVGPGLVERVTLEAWQDSPEPVTLVAASIVVRFLG